MIDLKLWTLTSLLGLAACAAFAAEPGSISSAPAKPVTFSKDIAPIFQDKCEGCHRKDSMAPMSLVTYEETRPWAKAIKDRVLRRQMPPWHLDPSVGIQKFQNDRSLSKEQMSTIVRWVDSGAPQGNPKDMPSPRSWADEDGWQLTKTFGQPDLILKSEPYTMPAVSQDQWWRPVTQIPITEPRWVRAVEIRPSTKNGRRITHHAIAYLLQKETGAPNPAEDPFQSIAGGGILMEWAIGKQYDVYRPNCGKLLVPGAKIWWDIHLHAVNEEITDNVELAIYFYPKGEVPKYRTYLTMFNAAPSRSASGDPFDQVGGLDIAPNTIAQTQGFKVLKSPARIENFQAHMHLRGKAMLMEAILPDGSTQILSYVDHFNFNWMNNYIYAEDAAPVLPKGTIIQVTAWHDNTTANPNNPDPNQWVGWGDRTVDEMAHAWVNVTYITDDDYKEWAAEHKPANRGLAGLF